jgi:hypothetical protein
MSDYRWVPWLAVLAVALITIGQGLVILDALQVLP